MRLQRPGDQAEVHLADHVGMTPGGVEQRAGAQQNRRPATLLVTGQGRPGLAPSAPPRPRARRVVGAASVAVARATSVAVAGATSGEKPSRSSRPTTRSTGRPPASPTSAVCRPASPVPQARPMARESAPGSPSRSARRSANAAASATYSCAADPPTPAPRASCPDRVTAYPTAGRPRPPAGVRGCSDTSPAPTSTRRWWRVVFGCPPTAATSSATVRGCAAGRAIACSSRRREGSVTSTGGSAATGVGSGPSGGIFFTT